MTGTPAHIAYEVRETSQVGEVRRAAVRVAEDLDFDEVGTGRVAIVATELGNNLVRHATGGRILVAPVEMADGIMAVELLSLDLGPGIPDVAQCMTDGHSTAGTPGTGLGAVRRLAHEFDIFSAVAAGTVVLARIVAVPARREVPSELDAARRQRVFEIGAITLSAPGEMVCGDSWAIARHGSSAALLVADGLGHGPLAREASQAAVAALLDAGDMSPSQMIERVHVALRGTRGAAVAMARVDALSDTFTYSGAGNIAGRVVSGATDKSLMSQHGTAGVQIRRLVDVSYDWPPHGLLVMHSDGVQTRWRLDDVPSLMQHHPTVVAGWLLRDQVRGRDDVTVAVLKRRQA
jgi:anti-sigma regulatory factor (Ser/Thr protein kinase)